MDTQRIVFIRHGQSTWNEANRFTGWVDVPLTERGMTEAREGGLALKSSGIVFDKAYTSVLKRAVKTCNIILEQMDQEYVPVEKDYRLCERMYGALAGLNKQETVDEHGIDQVMIWRRSYDVPPPSAELDHEYHPSKIAAFSGLDPEAIPKAESLKDTLERVLPYWKNVIEPEIRLGKTLLIAAHGNSIRAIVKHLDHIPEDVITKINIPTGVPLEYILDKATLKPIAQEGSADHLSGKYMIDASELAAKIAEVAHQTKA